LKKPENLFSGFRKNEKNLFSFPSEFPNFSEFWHVLPIERDDAAFLKILSDGYLPN